MSLEPPTTLLEPFNQVSLPPIGPCGYLLLQTNPCLKPLGDSKSTSQKLADETTSQGKSAYDTAADTLSSAGKSISDTVNKGTQQGSSNAGAAQESTKGYLEQAQDLAASALNTASKTASGMCTFPV